MTLRQILLKPAARLGALHAEGETKTPMVYIVALPEPRPFDQFLRLQPPETAPAGG